MEGIDWAVRVIERTSPIVILAPHSGHIEPTTSLVAEAIAAERYTLYCFEGLRPGRVHGDLHITSAHFDEPRALTLVGRARVAVAIHGYLESEADEPVLLGGLDAPLIALIARSLDAAGFPAATSGHRFPGRDPANICNRTARGRGVQIELSRTLRDRLRDDLDQRQRFAAAIHRAIDAHLPATG